MLCCRIVAAAIGVLCTVACGQPQRAPEVRRIHLASGMSPQFTDALSQRFSATIPGILVTSETMDGSIVIADAVQEGVAEIGIVQADVAYLAYRHGIDKSAYAHRDLRGIAVLWVNNLYVFANRESTITDVSQLRGKRVGLLVRGTSGEFISRVVLRAHGLTYDDMHVEFSRGSDLLTRLRSRELDVAVISYPFYSASSWSEFARLVPVRIDIFNRLQAEYPFFRRVSVPEPDGSGDVETVGTEAILLCRRDLSEELVYNFTKQLFVTLPALAQQSREATLIDVAQAPTTPIPLHSGAARFYRERELLH
jgi:uncharacterized protein